MKIIDCNGKDFQEICKEVRESEEKNIKIINCMGHRYICSGVGGKNVSVCVGFNDLGHVALGIVCIIIGYSAFVVK